MIHQSSVARLSYRLTADFVFFIHLLIVCAVAVGWIVPEFFYLHLILLSAAFFSEVFLGYCVLTRIEFGLRKKLDPSLVFDKSCIIHYIRKWRRLAPRPTVTGQASFFRRNSFLFILLSLGIVSFLYKIILG